MNFVCSNISSFGGRLFFAGQDVCSLAKEYGTPLYLMDENRIRHNCREYMSAFRSAFGENFRVLYASKANSFKQIYRIVAEEGLGVDVVSCGEILTAHSAGMDMSLSYFHSNNKTDADIAYAMEKGVGCFVADNFEEVRAIDAEAGRRGIKQKILLRLTPGIDTHTYEAVNTGKVDSKFGSAIETGQAEEILLATLALSNIDLAGFHCHVGSMVFAEDVFERSAAVMLRFIGEMQRRHGFVCRELDLGGGYGVRYVETDPYLDIAAKIADVAETVKACCEEEGIDLPRILLEPGRGIVADAGMTIYTVGTVKTIPGYKNYVSIDGGMTDNPRYALYESAYTLFCANRMDEKSDFLCDVVGRCCESGDIIQPKVYMPSSVGRGDTVAVCTTGAYNYSMASNYNRLPRPPIVMLRDGESYVAVKRESLEDLLRNDI